MQGYETIWKEKLKFSRCATAISLDVPTKLVNKPFLDLRSALLHEMAVYDYIKWIIDIMAYIPYNIYKENYMTEFKLIVYGKENGEVPVEEFLDSVNPKIFGLLEILQEKGSMLREPYSKHLDDGIFELRCELAVILPEYYIFFYYEGK